MTLVERFVNPLVLFLTVWGVAGAAYLGGVGTGLFPPPHTLTVAVLALNVGAFSVGYLTWGPFRRGQKREKSDKSEKSVKGPWGRLSPFAPFERFSPFSPFSLSCPPRGMERGLRFALLMGVAALLLMLYRVVQMAAYSHAGLFELLTHPTLLRTELVRFVDRSVRQANGTTMLISLTNGFFGIGFILLGVFLRIDTSFRKYAYLAGYLFVGLAICVVNLSRYDITAYTLYLVLAYGVSASAGRRRTDRRLLWALLPPAAGVVLVFGLVEGLLHKSALTGAAGSFRSILFSLYWYVASPLAAFNDFLTRFLGDYGWGERTFTPFVKWLARFHVIAPPSLSAFGEFVHIPYVANAYTYLRPFYQDFGIWGVAVFPYLLGGLLALLQGPARRNFPFLNLFVLLLVPTILSFLSYPLLASQFYLQALWGFLLFRYDLRTE